MNRRDHGDLEAVMLLTGVEATIHYLTTAEGGRRSGVYSGYKGQFHYLGEDDPADAVQYFPDLDDGAEVRLGTTVRAVLVFRQERWEEYHSKRVAVGMPFEVREGKRVVGHGVVTRLGVELHRAG